MYISWHGQYTIKIQNADTTLVLDPHSSDEGLSPFKGKADMVALTNPADKKMSYLKGISGKFLAINTPGEYTMHGCTLHAIGWQDENGKERSIHRWVIDKIVVLHVGALNRELTDTELQEISKTDIDVLIVPVGGGSSINTEQALKLVTVIEPRVVIPIHYKIPKLKEELESINSFAKEMAVNSKKVESKINLKHNKLPQEDMQTILLAP